MIQSSELILNPDGSVYHLNLKPEHIAHDIIFVGDQNRVEKITQFPNVVNAMKYISMEISVVIVILQS